MSVSAFPYGCFKAPSGGGGPTVSALWNGDYNSAASAPVYVGVKFDTNGNEYEYLSGGTFGSSLGAWLDSGSSSEVWVEYFNNTGTFLGKSAGTRYQCSTSPIFYTTANAIITIRTVTSQARFWDAASGGNTLQTCSSSAYTAEYTGGGGCPLCCLTPDTPILMANGAWMPIAKLRKGDRIIVFSKEKNCLSVEEVGGVITRIDRPMYRLTFASGRVLEASDDHPLEVRDIGPASLNHHDTPYKDLGLPAELKVGALVADLSLDGWDKLVKIERMDYNGLVFTLTNQRFFAGGLMVY